MTARGASFYPKRRPVNRPGLQSTSCRRTQPFRVTRCFGCDRDVNAGDNAAVRRAFQPGMSLRWLSSLARLLLVMIVGAPHRC
jgi:hypothetical protein